MSKKSTKQATGQNHDGEKNDQTALTAKGREHTIAQGVKAMRTSRKPTTAQNEPLVEVPIGGTGAHSIKPETATAETPKTTKAKETKAPTLTAAVPDQPDDSEDLVVFAFRLSRAERDLIHHAAGAAKASKFARNLLVAFARGDGGTVHQILETLQAPEGGAKK